MPMADGTNRLKRIKFVVGDRSFKFAINPENYVHEAPHRTTTLKTKSRIIIEDFQNDIATITIKGTTGMNPTGRKADRGIEKIKEMKSFLERYSEMGGDGDSPAQDFYFHNYTNDESYVVHLQPEGVKYTQDAKEPTMFRYEISFAILRKAGEPPEDDIMEPEIGNRFPTLPQGSKEDSDGTGPPSVHQGPGGPVDYDGTTTNEYNKNREYDSSGSDSVYRRAETDKNKRSTGTGMDNEPFNPQDLSPASYLLGQTGLGYSIGYYGRGY